jgi:hypothetical protein
MCTAGISPATASIEKRAPWTAAEATAAGALCTKFGYREIHRPKAAWGQAFNHLSTAVETGVERGKMPAQPVFFYAVAACFQALSGHNAVAMIAASRSLAEGAATRRATPR